jgi:cob(I)alamin adenosyltransferase
MVNLTRIYTRAGDGGQTRLGDNSVANKTDARLAAFADVDEANSCLGVVLALCRTDLAALDAGLPALLERIQNDLFDVGADLSTPYRDDPPYPPLRITPTYVDALEEACDRFNALLEPLRSFVLPGGSVASAQLHVARTVVRRAERSAWAAAEQLGLHEDDGNSGFDGGVSAPAIRYLNRLSDLLFILARVANRETGDVLWRPGASR